METDETLNEMRERYDSGEFPLSTLRQVVVNRPGRPQEAFALRLPPEVVAELKVMADVRGIGVTQLVREWILERLELERTTRNFGSFAMGTNESSRLANAP